MKKPRCPNAVCSKSASVIRHGHYKTKSGRRRRYRCSSCGRTFSSTTRTAYHRLQHRRSIFDEVAALSVEGLSKSAIARVKGLAWNTVDRWLQKAATFSRQFNDEKMHGFHGAELQLDEIRTFCGGKKNVTWIFTSIEVWSRLWPVALVGRRSYTNTREVMREVRDRMAPGANPPLVVTDGFDYYPRVVREVFGPMCLFGQVIKTRRNDRVVKVERKHVVGARRKFETFFADSEDSPTLNTSFSARGCARRPRRCSSCCEAARTYPDWQRNNSRWRKHLSLSIK